MTGARIGSARCGVVLLAVVALAAACSRRTGKTVATPKQPANAAQLVPGPPIQPPGPLLEWLGKVKDAPGPRKLLRLPVVVRFEDEYRLAFGDAVVGVSEAAFDDGQALHVKLDDTGMGVALLTTLKGLCPGATCAVWLEGHWGPLVRTRLPGLGGGGDGRHPFAVLRLHGLVEASAKGAEVRVLLTPPVP